MHGAVDGQAGNVKGLRQNIRVHGLTEQQPKRGWRHVGWRQRGLGKIGAGPVNVILPSEHRGALRPRRAWRNRR